MILLKYIPCNDHITNIWKNLHAYTYKTNNKLIYKQSRTMQKKRRNIQNTQGRKYISYTIKVFKQHRWQPVETRSRKLEHTIQCQKHVSKKKTI